MGPARTDSELNEVALHNLVHGANLTRLKESRNLTNQASVTPLIVINTLFYINFQSWHDFCVELQ